MAATQEKQTDRWLKNLFEHNSFNYGFAFYCAMTPYYYLITATQLSEEPPRNVMRKTWQTLGISGFYRGFQMSWLAFGLRYCAPFGNRDFENMKQDIYPDKLRNILLFTAFDTLLLPLHHLRVKCIDETLQSSAQDETSRRFKSIFAGFSSIAEDYKQAKEKNWKYLGLYRGSFPFALTSFSTLLVLNLPVYRILCQSLIEEDLSEQERAENMRLMSVLSSSLTGVAVMAFTTPFEVVRVRMQSFEGINYENSLECAKDVWKRFGFFGFYKGASVYNLKAVVFAVALGMYYTGQVK